MIKIGNVASKPSNMLVLMAVRNRVASFENQSHFVGQNFKQLEPALKQLNAQTKKL